MHVSGFDSISYQVLLQNVLIYFHKLTLAAQFNQNHHRNSTNFYIFFIYMFDSYRFYYKPSEKKGTRKNCS